MDQLLFDRVAEDAEIALFIYNILKERVGDRINDETVRQYALKRTLILTPKERQVYQITIKNQNNEKVNRSSSL